MHFPSLGELTCLAAVCIATCAQARADEPVRAVDPGVRRGDVGAGAPLTGVDAQYFANTRFAFKEVHSIAGDVESGAGLGPRFNGTSCGGCHAWPALGGSSPERNPQFKMAAAHGARNRIPDFLKADGPVLVVRVKAKVNLAGAGEVLPLFTVNGRADAFSCAVEAPDFTRPANFSFRIPTPVFGAGLIDNIPDAVIAASRAAHAKEKAALAIGGEPNAGSDGALGKFGWKAQLHSLTSFAGDAYLTEMGVPNEVSGYGRGPLSTFCYTLYEAAYDDPHYSESYDLTLEGPIFLFTEFMRFLKPPTPVTDFAGVAADSIRKGRRLFERAGCALCHTPSLRTGADSDLPVLNGRDAQLYSDLLLHHMGPKLADGIVQGRAGPDEFRTAPLWGLGQRIFFLHDGRTADLIQAIQDHASDGGGLRSEAIAVIGRFNALRTPEQQDILNFLRSL
jgi:CxxC motif-containing protein (DUF1111 family)